MLIPEVHRALTVLFATIDSYEANSVFSAVAIAGVAWIALFGILLSTGSKSPRWQSGEAVRRTVLVWSWFWTSGAICSLAIWWGFIAWRVSSGLVLVPTAPNVPIGVIFAYGLSLAAVLLVVGWVPRVFSSANDGAADTQEPAEPPTSDEDQAYQPLYPGLSFEQPHQQTSYQPQAPEALAEQEPSAEQETPTDNEEPAPSRRRWVVAAGVAVLLVGIIGAFGVLVAPSAPAMYDRLASEGLSGNLAEDFAEDLSANFSENFAENFADSFAGIFTDDAAAIIRDDALDFQTSGTEIREGDFAIDVDRWRPLAEQGNAVAQFKLGVMYANGRGAPRDYIEAHRWLNIAGAQGNEKAIEGRDAVTRQMTPAEIEAAQKLARETVSIAAPASFDQIPVRLKEMNPRELIRETQTLLKARGYDVGSADGVAGPRTQAAVREFERGSGLPVTGGITPQLVARLRITNRPSQRDTSKPGQGRVLDPPLSRPSVSAPPPRRAAPRTECDTLAAHPSNGLRSAGVSGIAFARIDATRAIGACERAVAKYPDELRFQFQLARSLHKAESYSEAMTLYSKAGAQGFALAQRSVGFMYANGSGVAQDLGKAARWLHQAAERCDADAQFALGTLYTKGQGVEKSEAESLRWFRIAAAQDHPDARDRLNGFANSSDTLSLGSGQTGASASDAALRAGHNFEPGDYTATRHIDRLLVKQERNVIEAFERNNYSAALETLRPLAEQGAAPAQTLLGYMYRTGLGIEQNDTEAVEWYRKAADQEDPDAQYLLGYMYQRGYGVSQYFARALRSYRNSAGQGVSAARVALGVMYDNAQGIAYDRDEALAQYSSAAEAGLAGAQHSLAMAYETGDGVQRDLNQALKWYRMAAAQNFALSQNRLGELYSRGKGVPRDQDEALTWFRLAAEQGLPDAQFNLAKNFAAGSGVPRDPSEAFKLYTLAAERGHAEGQVSVAIAHLKGRGVDRSYGDAVAWFQRAAAQCNADAQFQLASMYRLGKGVAKASVAEELKWLKLAAEQGHAEALQALSARYADGNGVQKDPARALKSLRRAAERGHPKAQSNLAEIYAKGSEEVPQDYAMAAQWYRKAALQGDREAQYNLARLYREGHGVARSYIEAVTWYRRAAEQGDPLAQHNLATAYRLGAGTERDHAAAVRWYRQAAEQGEASSQRDLGLLYLRGEGVLQDYTQARLWLGLAASQGDAEAEKAVDRLARKMTPDQIAEADRLAAERLPGDG